MKIKSCVATLLAVFSLGLMTSCEDMFDIQSNRVVYDHDINSTADSVYSTLGVLQSMRKIADRYVILGEVRGDMAMINELSAKTSIRNLANFNFDDDNEYLNVRDYYAVINNCNYALAKMDTTLAINNQRVMMDEYVALQGIRAWTYLQLAINYGDVYFYTDPVISESDVERVKSEGKKDIKVIAEGLAPQLIPYLDYDLPSWSWASNVYPVLRLVLADLYLWSGDYENATKYLEEYFMKNKKFSYSKGDDNGTEVQPGYVSLGGALMSWNGEENSGTLKASVDPVASAELYTSRSVNNRGYENLAYITMEASGETGIASELLDLFLSFDNTHALYPSAYWKSLTASQRIFKLEKKNDKKTLKISDNVYDMRKEPYFATRNIASEDGNDEGESFDVYTKHVGTQINIYRRSIACLRWAEAMNALARQRYEVAADSAQKAEARQLAVNSFYLLKDASKVFFPDSSDVQKKFARMNEEVQADYVGIHARGAGDVAYDTLYYVLKPKVIGEKLYGDSVALTFNDTIEYIDNLIIDELALESTLEGNRFGDLVRFAKRRQLWGDGDYRDFLALRVASRSGEINMETLSLYSKLSSSEEFWYLPFK